MENNPISPPAMEERNPRSVKFKSFLQSLCRHFFKTTTYVVLFVLMVAISGYLIKQKVSKVPAVSVGIQPISSVPRIPEFREIVAKFDKNKTFTEALTEHGLPVSLVNQIIESAHPVYNLGVVKAGQSYWLSLTNDGIFRNFRYPVDDERYLTVYRDAHQDRLVSVMNKFEYETRTEIAEAVIDASLFASVMNIGEKDQLALDLAEIFGSDIDFYTDIQPGDSFKVLVEKKYLDGKFSKYGSILAAEFVNQGKQLNGFLFEDENGKPAYYGPDGRSLKKSFLKSPLKFARISSKFTYARRHPILKTVRPHLGVDYAAPSGTPVQAVGSGVVVGAGYSGGGGKTVRIRHAGDLETTYMHLSRIAVRSGARITQGQVLGYVGSTGLSTGPHLDFRVRRKGKAVNPLKVIYPPGAPVARDKFESFAALRDKMIVQLNSKSSQSDTKVASGESSKTR